MTSSVLLHTAAETMAAAGLEPRWQEPLARRGWWRLGGPADLYVEVSTAEQLEVVLSTGLPILVLGNGSNLLVADAGIRGIVIRLIGTFRETSWLSGSRVDAGAGLLNTVLLRRLEKANLGGLGSLAGVPGTIGGAIRMNAGTYLGEIGDVVEEVEVVLPNATRRVLSQADVGFSYRRAVLPPGAIIVRARLRLVDDPVAVRSEQESIRAHLQRRMATQPLDQPSCGSVFKNPPGDTAGRLIDSSGLKGKVCGGAAISEKHANFIVNTGGASASDVLTLVRLARDTVFQNTGVVLEPEVHAVGDWPAESWPLPPVASRD